MKTNASLRRNRRLGAIAVNDDISSCRSIATAVQAVRSTRAPVCQKRDLGHAQQFQLAHNAITASMLSLSSTPWTQRVPRYTEWIRILQGLGWSVQRVGHMRVYS